MEIVLNAESKVIGQRPVMSKNVVLMAEAIGIDIR